MRFVEKSPIGVFVFDEGGRVIWEKFFSKNQEAVKQFLDSLPSEALEAAGQNYAESNKFINKQFRKIAKENFVNDEELNSFLTEFALELSKNQMKGIVGKDKLLLHAINAYDEIEKQLNIMNQRLAEWYSLHYPERKPSSDEIERFGRRENFPSFKDSLGIEIDEIDEQTFRDFARTISVLKNEQSKLKRYVKDISKEIMLNTSSIIDPLLAARMLSMAGSLEKFSRMTASTIQLIGAEKALFRHLRKEGKSPKYGIIFLDQRIQQATPEKRGKVARILASKVSQAVRIDFYSKRDDTERLKNELNEELMKC